MKNYKNYYRAWELRQQGHTFKEIGRLMGYKTGEWPRVMIWRTNRKILTQKRLPKDLMILVDKFNKI